MKTPEVLKTMKIGLVNYPKPPDVEASRAMEWFLRKSWELGCTVAGVSLRRVDDIAPICEVVEDIGIDIEPWVSGVFDLAGPDSAEGRTLLLEHLSKAKQMGSKVVRSCYGNMAVEKSRYNKDYPVADQMEFVVKNLKEAAKIIEDHELLMGIENHCDFNGKEWAQILEEVGSQSIGMAFDTGNWYWICCDPSEVIEYLVPYVISTHVKDMIMRTRGWDIPPRVYHEGCNLGEGNVDIPGILETIAKRSPYAEGLHLIIEPMSLPAQEGKTGAQISKEFFDTGVEYLQRMTG